METTEYLPLFLAEGREHLEALELAVVRIEERPDDRETIDAIFRGAHSLKAISAALGFAAMAALTHEMENVFELLRQRRGGLEREVVDVLLECLDVLSAALDAIDATGEERLEPAALIERLGGLVRADRRERTPVAPAERAPRPPRKGSATVRIEAARLDRLMDAMGELARHRTQVEALAAQAAVPGLAQAVQELARTSQALEAMVLRLRMIPAEAMLIRFPRLVRDLSAKLGKHVELRLEGKETEIDRAVVDAIGDALVHLVRNSLDHGIEPPDERAAAGKPAAGLLEISARRAGGRLVVEVRDDGRGVDPLDVARKAAEQGLLAAEAVESFDPARAAELLFSPGFSTADVTSEVSGRGVGLDAVRTAVLELGGDVAIVSEPGRGTTARIALIVDCDALPDPSPNLAPVAA
jgi:two-component system chemotaxis sensor kinase CheA